jgi:hypothetical protein
MVVFLFMKIQKLEFLKVIIQVLLIPLILIIIFHKSENDES